MKTTACLGLGAVVLVLAGCGGGGGGDGTDGVENGLPQLPEGFQEGVAMPDLIPAEVPGEPGHTCRITQRGLEVYVQNIGNVDAPSSRVYVRYSGGFGVAEHLSQHYTGVIPPGQTAHLALPFPPQLPAQIDITVDYDDDVWEFNEDNNDATDYR